jgi:hypothetical protein
VLCTGSPAIPVSAFDTHQRSTLRCKIIVRDFSASAPHRPRHIVLSKHFAQDDQQYCQEYQQCALQNDAINLPKLWPAMNPPLLRTLRSHLYREKRVGTYVN